MKILLGATIALLLGAVALSWNNMKHQEANTSPDEMARLKKQVEDIRREQDYLVREKQIQMLRTSEPVPQKPVSSIENDNLKAQLAAKEAELQIIQEAKDKATRKADVLNIENATFEGKELEKSDSELRRARLISEALVMGRVREYADDPALGGFVTFEVLMPANVQTGSVLAIRRKTGIIGQLKVSEISPDGAIANLLQGVGKFTPMPGDELILPPQD